MATGTVFNNSATMKLVVPIKTPAIPSIRKSVQYFLFALLEENLKINDILLVVSELLTNALLHSGDNEIDLSISVNQNEVQVCLNQKKGEVHLAKRGQVEQSNLSENGRGLLIINHIGDIKVTNKNGVKVTATIKF